MKPTQQLNPIKVSLPLSTEQVQDLFLNIDNRYIVELGSSKLKGEALITYLANMQVKCQFEVEQNISTEDKLSILYHFLTYRQTVYCETLIETMAYVFYRSRGIQFIHRNEWLSLNEIDTFINSHTEVIKRVSEFLDSALLFAPSFDINFKKSILEPGIESGEIECIEDPNYVGVNCYGLFNIHDFLEHFISRAPDEHLINLKYFKTQVEDIQYNRQHLFQIFLNRLDHSFLMSVSYTLFSTNPETKPVFEKMLGTFNAQNYLAQETISDSSI